MRAPFVAVAAFSASLLAEAVTFENVYAKIVLDGKGRVVSVLDKAAGRELVEGREPFVSCCLADGTRIVPERVDGDGKALLFDFGEKGAVELAVTPFAKRTGWNVSTGKVTLRGVESLTYARLAPKCAAKKGHMSNIVMDDVTAVAIRGYDIASEMYSPSAKTWVGYNDGATYVYVKKGNPFENRRAGLAIAPRSQILDVMKDMLDESGVPQTGCGGPYSLEAEGNRRSYLFGTWMDYGSFDDWLRLMAKSGCQMFHLHAWWKTRGSYEVDPNCFPGGYGQLRECVDRLHAKGYSVSTHTLSASIQFGDPLIDPKNFDELIADAEYTLARDFREGDDVLYVNEIPVRGHAKVLTGDTNGNILRIGDDLLQYSDFSRERPYRFTGIAVAREPWGDIETFDPAQAVQMDAEAMESFKAKRTRRLVKGSHPAGSRLQYLHHRYASFFAKPGTALADRCIEKIAKPYNELGLEGIFLDGAEGFGALGAVEWFRTETTSRLKKSRGEVFNHSSYRNPFNWWQRGVFGAWDYPTYGPKPFHRRHLRAYLDVLEADFLKAEMGWWNTRAANANGRGYFPDEMEFFCSKTVASDCSASLVGTAGITDGPLPFMMDDQITIFGWWMGPRYARAFRPDLLERMKADGDEWRLRQDGRGEWRVTPFSCAKHRVASADLAEWTVASVAERPAELRVEALYAADHEAAKASAFRIIDASMLDRLVVETAPGVKASAAAGTARRPGAAAEEPTIVFSVTNVSAARNGSWAALGRDLPERTYDRACPVSTLWVKGDGSGAVLNVQVARAREFAPAYSENFVMLDFTGWRKVDLLLRERDTDASERYEWPYIERDRVAGPGQVFSTRVSGRVVGGYRFYVNGVAPGRSVTVELGAWDGIPQRKGTMPEGAVVTVNGDRFAVPFALAGGEWAELKGGAWWHYSEMGLPLGKAAAPKMPRLRAGANALRLDSPARAEVTVFGLGADEPAFMALTPKMKALMATEYEFPAVLNAKANLSGPVAVRVRPGEKAALRFEILGPVRNPTVMGRRIPVELRSAQERIDCHDGRTWEAIRITPGANNGENRTLTAKRERFAAGSFEPLPVLEGGVTEVPISADESAGARFTFFKEYQEGGRRE